MPNPNFFIKYDKKGINEKFELDLELLGQSIIGFDHAIKEVIKISKIKGEIDIKAANIREGSLIVDIIIALNTGAVPFDSVNDLLVFIRSVDYAEYLRITNSLMLAHDEANEFFAKYALDALLVTKFVEKMFNWAKKQKRIPVLISDKEEIPKEYAIKLHKLIKKKTFRKALKPFIEEKVTEISISASRDFLGSAIINEGNFEDYLSEDEKILPELENGKICKFVGRIVGLESSRGESLKFKADNIDKKFSLLIAHPANEKKTEDFIEFYKKDVNIMAEVYRKSFYQKPQLIIHNIYLRQESLNIN